MKTVEFNQGGSKERAPEYTAPSSLQSSDGASRPIEPAAASRPGPSADVRAESRFAPQAGINSGNTSRETKSGTGDSGNEQTKEPEGRTAPSTNVNSPTAPTALSVLNLGDLWQSAKISGRATMREVKETEKRIGRDLTKAEIARIEHEKNALADQQVLAKKQAKLRAKIERRGGSDVTTFTDIFDARTRPYIKKEEERLGRKLTVKETRSATRQAILDKKKERMQKEQRILAAR